MNRPSSLWADLAGRSYAGRIAVRGWSSRKADTDNPAFPDLSPLQARMVVNDIENKVWHGLKSMFHDHMVMVKIPVLRYAKLQDSSILKAASGSNNREDHSE